MNHRWPVGMSVCPGHVAVPALVEGFDSKVRLSPWLGLAAKSLSHSKSSENPSTSSAVGGAAGAGCDIIGWTASSARSRPRGPTSRGNRRRLLRGSGCIPVTETWCTGVELSTILLHLTQSLVQWKASISLGLWRQSTNYHTFPPTFLNKSAKVR